MRTARDSVAPRVARSWRPNAVTIVVAGLVTLGLAVGLYPSAAAWTNAVNQASIIADARQDLAGLEPTASEQLRRAGEYNAALTAGVRLDAGGNIPVGTGTLDRSALEYRDLLTAGPDGLMGRVRIPGIDVDLPVYHGTSEATLLRGAGHLEGTHLPIGGVGTRAVITAHRGLANATMFTDLDRVAEGDVITVETLGQVSVYSVISIQVIEPDDTRSLRAEPGRDLLTLVTCTPLGINTHRIIVTGERITPTPPEEVDALRGEISAAGFPWWSVVGLGGVGAVGAYVVRRGFVDSRLRWARSSGATQSSSA